MCFFFFLCCRGITSSPSPARAGTDDVPWHVVALHLVAHAAGYVAQHSGGRRVLVEPDAVGNRSGDGLNVRAHPDTVVQQRVRAGDCDHGTMLHVPQ